MAESLDCRRRYLRDTVQWRVVVCHVRVASKWSDTDIPRGARAFPLCALAILSGAQTVKWYPQIQLYPVRNARREHGVVRQRYLYGRLLRPCALFSHLGQALQRASAL